MTTLLNIIVLVLICTVVSGAEIIDMAGPTLSKDDKDGIVILANDYFTAIQKKDYALAASLVVTRQREYMKNSFKTFNTNIPSDFSIGLFLEGGKVSISIVNTSIGGQCEKVDGKWHVFYADIDEKLKP